MPNKLTNFADSQTRSGEAHALAVAQVRAALVVVAPHRPGPGPLGVHAVKAGRVPRSELVQPDVSQLLRPAGLHGPHNTVHQSEVSLNILLQIEAVVSIQVVR